MFPIRQYTFKRNKEKDAKLRKTRGVSFDDVTYAIERRDIIDIMKSPLKEKYPKQWNIVVTINKYPHLVPFVVEDEGICFLKTIYANRKYKYKL